MAILSYAGQVNRTQSNVVEQPPFLNSNQKPLKWWAQDGLIYCIDPNRPNRKPTYSQPLDALRRVAMGIKIFLADITEKPKDYVVTRSVLANFFNDFKMKVFDVALEQDAKNGDIIARTRDEYEREKRKQQKEMQIEAAKYADKRTKIFISPKAASS